MTQPKAKWNCDPDNKSADAKVGLFNFEVYIGKAGGQWRVYSDDLIADGLVDGPCDIADLMRLAEAELARRLQHAAETMDGGELVAGQARETCAECGLPAQTGLSGLCQRCDEHKRWWG